MKESNDTTYFHRRDAEDTEKDKILFSVERTENKILQPSGQYQKCLEMFKTQSPRQQLESKINFIAFSPVKG